MFTSSSTKIVEMTTGYAPRPLQQQIHREMRRFTVLAIHRRFGKTVCAINELIDGALTCPCLKPRVAYIAPYYKQAKAVAWDYAKQFTENIPNAKAYESELRIDIPLGEKDGKKNTARLQLFGADHPDSLRGLYFDVVVFDEFGLQPSNIWTEVVRPALADRHGLEGNVTRALFLGTPCGKNAFYEMYQDANRKMLEGHPEWFAQTYRADETNVIAASELESAKEDMPEEDYRQEFLCDWAAAIRGAFYASDVNKIRERGQIMRVPYEKHIPVFVAWDLGLDDASALWFCQCYRNEIRLIRYEEFTNMGLVDILAEISNYGYVYAAMIMPWDVKIREYTTGKTRLETVESLGFTVEVAPKLSVADGVTACRTVLSNCYIDEVHCERGIDCLENYRKKFDSRVGLFLETPIHDEFSHGAVSFRTLSTAYDPIYAQQTVNGRFGQFGATPKVKRST